MPAFKGLYGFPGSICLSINQEIVHGIPSPKRELRAGDILSIDIGVKYQGYYTDAAVTVPVGEVPKESVRLLAVTQEALVRGHFGSDARESPRRYRRRDLGRGVACASIPCQGSRRSWCRARTP